MKIVEINTVDYGSTGKIMLQIADLARENGHKVITYSIESKNNQNNKNHRYYLSKNGYYCHYILGVLTGNNGSFSYFATKKMVNEIRKFEPDIVHIHNIHGFCINFKVLFNYLKNANVKVVWTFHDCWPFTGHCPHFIFENCTKWKNGCYRCNKYRGYPKSFFDNSHKMWKKKKELFTGVEQLSIVTPSIWLKSLVLQSFFSSKKVYVINNGIDTNIFRPRKSYFRNKYNISNCFVILGVALRWGYKKGIDMFIELSKCLNSNFKIVLVGVTESEKKELPKEIIAIGNTNSSVELAEIYSAADVFVNPTREDNFPTVNLEAIACGTPVVTFNTGGSREIIDDEVGSIIEDNSIEGLKSEIIRVFEKKPFSKAACRQRALQYDKKLKFMDYLSLFETIVGEGTNV